MTTPGASTPDSSLKARCDAARSHLYAGRPGEAERLFRSVLADNPDYAPAMQGMGEIAFLAEVYPDAAEYYGAALQIDPTLTPALVSLGLALQWMGRRAEAYTAFEKATLDDPTYAMGFYWLGLAQLARGDRTGALASLHKALGLKPDLIGPLGHSFYNFLETCEWRTWDVLTSFMGEALEGPNQLYSPMNLMMVNESSEAIAKCARMFARDHFPAGTPLCAGPYPRRDKIRIAYISTDFYEHPVSHLLVGVLEAHDRNAFELTAISYGPNQPGPTRERLERAFDHFCDMEKAGEEAMARAIAERQIDIAITLNGYTTHCLPEILARRPAPIQVNYHGFPGTMGASYIDYIIGDPVVIPKDQTPFYDEKVVWMPHSYQPTDDKLAISAQTPTRASQGLPAGGFVFMGYNRMHKVSPMMFDVWMRILSRVPGSVLWLQDGGPVAQGNLRREAAARGVAPDRLVFATRVDSRGDHLARQRLADLFLDTTPYNAHATASDALYAGLPVITRIGSAFPGRVCAGLLTAAGFPELICETLSDYEELAVALASDPARLADLRARVEKQAPKSPLFQTARYARHLEAAFRTMYERSQAGLPPESFAVPA